VYFALAPGELSYMPTYEYECDKCKRVYEQYQSITADPLTKCRAEGCDGTVHRMFSPGAGFIFKGSGFYITDNRSESYKQKARSDSGSSSSSSSSSSTSSSTPSSTSSGSSSGSPKPPSS
jgi:putative FmdB family regulatory protein